MFSPIGQEHDRRRAVEPDLHVVEIERLGVVGGRVLLGEHDRLAGDQGERGEDALTERCRPSGVRRLTAAFTLAFSFVGRWSTSEPSLNATIPMRIAEGCRSTNAAAAAFATSQPRRLQVVRAHAVGDVERENHGSLALRQAQIRLWASKGEQQQREPGEEEREWHVPSPPHPQRRLVRREALRGELCRSARAPPHQLHVSQDEQRRKYEETQRGWPRERHQRSRRPRRSSTMRTSALTRSSSVETG